MTHVALKHARKSFPFDFIPRSSRKKKRKKTHVSPHCGVLDKVAVLNQDPRL